jgi:predicted ribonuclease YlaK
MSRSQNHGCPRQWTKKLEVKNYILDTNVLLHDPNSLLSFRDNARPDSHRGSSRRSTASSGKVVRTRPERQDRLANRSTRCGHQGRLSEGVRLATGRLSAALHLSQTARTTGHELSFGNNTVDSRIVALAQANSKRTQTRSDSVGHQGH